MLATCFVGEQATTKWSQEPPPLAKWSCCKEEIPRWDDAWNSRDGMIPFDLVDSGCLEGMYDSKRVSKSFSRHSLLYPLLAKPLPKANTEEKTE